MLRVSGGPPRAPINMEIVELTSEEAALSEVNWKRYQQNWDWLMAHWKGLQAEHAGKFIAVAGAQPFIADSAKEAILQAEAVFPEEYGGLICKYLPPDGQPAIRIYAHIR